MKKNVMKKIAMILIALMTLAAMMTIGHAAEQTPWYELSFDDTVLTVRLPGENWNWEISDPTALELITVETNDAFAASFMSTAGAANTVSLILRQAEDPAQAADATRVFELTTDESNVLTINSVLTIDPAGDWYEIDENDEFLVVRLPGGDWSCEIVDPELVELDGVETTEDAYTARFFASMVKAGITEIVFTSEDGLQMRTIEIFVNEGGGIYAERVEKFEIFASEEPFVPAVLEPVEFKTVTVTGGTVNLRVAATTEVDSIAKLHKGDIARYLGQTAVDDSGMEWYKVAFGEMDGWISAKYVKMGGEGYVRIVDGNVNMRAEANMDGDVITVLEKGTTVKYLGKGMTDSRGADWYKVSYGSHEGWVSAKYAVFSAAPAPKEEKKDTEYKYAKIVNGSANLRKSADKDSEKVTTVKEGTVVKYLGKQATDSRGVVWYKVSYKDNACWVSSKYAKLTNNSGEKKQDDSDMRLVYNPNRYDLIQIHDIYSQDGQTIYVVCNFGTTDSSGQPTKFDSRKNVTLKLVAGAEVMLPADPSSDDNLRETADCYMWFNDAQKEAGGSYMFYATFSMNEAGELRSLVYRPMY